MYRPGNYYHLMLQAPPLGNRFDAILQGLSANYHAMDQIKHNMQAIPPNAEELKLYAGFSLKFENTLRDQQAIIQAWQHESAGAMQHF